MLRKLLKYDIRTPKLIFLITSVSLVLMFTCEVFFIKFLFNRSLFFSIICNLFSGILALSSVIAISLPLIISLVNFRRTVCTDEAYFTFTLPIPRRMIIREKTLLAVVWFVLTDIVLLLSLIWSEFLNLVLDNNTEFEMFSTIPFENEMWGIVWAVLIAVPIIQFVIYEIGAYYFIYRATSNRRQLKSKSSETILFVVLIIAALDVLPSLLIVPIMIFVLFCVDTLPVIMSDAQIVSFLCIFVWQCNLAGLLISTSFHASVLERLENKLNLP